TRTQQLRLFSIATAKSGLACHLEEELRHVTPIQAVSLVVVDVVDRELGSPSQQMFLRIEVVPCIRIRIVNVGLGIESRFGTKAVAAPSVMKVGVEAVPKTADVSFECRTGAISAIALPRGTLNCLEPADRSF